MQYVLEQNKVFTTLDFSTELNRKLQDSSNQILTNNTTKYATSKSQHNSAIS